MTECWLSRGVSTASSAEVICRPRVAHVADHGGDAGAAHSHQHLFQPERARTALWLPPEDQELLLDGDGVQGPVFFPLGVDAASVSALGLRDLRGEPVGVPGDAVGRAGRSGWWDQAGKMHKGWGPRSTGRPPAGRRCRVTPGCSAGAAHTAWTQMPAPGGVLNSLSLCPLNYKTLASINVSFFSSFFFNIFIMRTIFHPLVTDWTSLGGPPVHSLQSLLLGKENQSPGGLWIQCLLSISPSMPGGIKANPAY